MKKLHQRPCLCNSLTLQSYNFNLTIPNKSANVLKYFSIFSSFGVKYRIFQYVIIKKQYSPTYFYISARK